MNVTNKTIKSIKHKIDSIINENYLQKFIVECYNNVIEGIINISSKDKKNNVVITHYSFNKFLFFIKS